MSGVQLNINVGSPNSSAVFDSINNGLRGITDSLNLLNRNFIGFSQQSIGALNNLQAPIQRTQQNFSSATNSLLAFNQAVEGVKNLGTALNDTIQPGVALDTQLHDLSAITGQTGEGLERIEKAARETAKQFGNDAAKNVDSYKLLLSQLSPEIANNAVAMKMMGENVNILSKTMSGNTVAAAETLTTAMNQYGVSTEDPILASKVMAEMMNIMAAGAKEGSAEMPQIKAALEQSGMMAKTTGVAFNELNASIQVLDKAGKRGSEGGVAIRNILAELSQGAMNSPKTIAMLHAAGINVDRLSDRSLSFSQRLKMLAPIANNTAAMTQLFGKENVAAAIALAQQTDEIDRLTTKITGTNTAVEQANIVMQSHEERSARIKARIDDWKISLFSLTESFTPYLTHTLNGITTAGQFASGLNAIRIATKALTAAKVEDAAASTGAGVANGFFSRMLAGVRNGLMQATLSVRGFSLALFNIPVIGWIAAAIAAVVVAFKLLWDHSRRFREILFGIWEAAKAVFTNIGIVVGRIWNMVIKPIIQLWWDLYTAVFSAIWDAAKTVFEGIGSFFTWLWDVIVSVGTAIGNFFAAVWDFLKNLFGGVVGFINDWIVQPIKSAFAGIWDFIVGIFDGIIGLLKKIFAPIIWIVKKIFSSDGMEDVSTAYEEGVKQGGESYDKDHAKTDDATATATPGSDAAEQKKISDMMKGMGGNAAGLALGKGKGGGTGTMSSNIGGGKPTSITLKIDRVYGIEKFIGTVSEAAKKAGQNVLEEVVLAISSVNGKVSTN